MIRSVLSALLITLAPSVAVSEVAVVRGGEHPDFTRLAIQAREIGGWKVARGSLGYEIQLSPSVSGFDTSSTFDRLSQRRLLSVSQDVGTGRLKVFLNCECHADAFSIGDNLLVVDFYDGDSPHNPSIERSFDGSPWPRRVYNYDWFLFNISTKSTAFVSEDNNGNYVFSEPSIDLLRDALLIQISRGVADGLVDVAEPIAKSLGDSLGGSLGGAAVMMGEVPGLSSMSGAEAAASESAIESRCISNELLDPSAWLHEASGVRGMAAKKASLFGEFDIPENDLILFTAKSQIAMGFGAEARETLKLSDARGDRKVLELMEALSYIVDLEAPVSDDFAGMNACSGLASLWGLLSDIVTSDVAAVGGYDLNSIVISFNSLPEVLRRHLGVELTYSLVRLDEIDAANKIFDAVRRARPEHADVMLLEGFLMLSKGDYVAAVEMAKKLLRESWRHNLEALQVLVEATFEADISFESEVSDMINVFPEGGILPKFPIEIDRSYALALEVEGRLEAAVLAAKSEKDLEDIWFSGVWSSSDEEFLKASVGFSRLIHLSLPVRKGVAARLLELGFVKDSHYWINL